MPTRRTHEWTEEDEKELQDLYIKQKMYYQGKLSTPDVNWNRIQELEMKKWNL